LTNGKKRLLATFDETGRRNNRLIVFTSDQGLAWRQHGFRHKVAAYDANIRPPLVVNVPGNIPQKSACPPPIGGGDLAPRYSASLELSTPVKCTAAT
jgi:arylsulfatase A-like enzyme